MSSTANNVYVGFNKFSTAANTPNANVYRAVDFGGTDSVFENNKIVDSDSSSSDRLDYGILIVGNNAIIRNNRINHNIVISCNSQPD